MLRNSCNIILRSCSGSCSLRNIDDCCNQSISGFGGSSSSSSSSIGSGASDVISRSSSSI